MEVVSYHNWSDFVYIDSWGFVVWDFKKTNWRYCIAVLTFIFGECNKASDNIWTFPRIPIHTFGKKQRHGLPVHRFYHAAFAPKRWNGTETALVLRYRDCRFLPNAYCGEKIFESGAKREGRSGFRNQDIFFFLAWLKLKVQFSIQYRIVPKSESGRLWQLFLPIRQISATKRTTGHDPCSFLFRLEGTKLRSNIELSINCNF